MKHPTHTVRGRFLLISCVTIVGSMLLLGFFSLLVIQQTVSSRGRFALQSSVGIISESLEQEYYDVLQITQQMMPTGRLGMDVEDVLGARSVYALGQAKRLLAKEFVLITFSAQQSELAVYCVPEGDEVLFGSMTTKRSFSAVRDLNVLYANDAISFHAMHTSQAFASDKPVVSVSRKTSLGGQDAIIYVETRTGVQSSLNKLLQNNDATGYVFVQLDADGMVRYSSTPDFAVGQSMREVAQQAELFGSWNGYMWGRGELAFGFYNVLLQPWQTFYADVFRWLAVFMVGLALTALVIALSALLMRRLILDRMNVMFQRVDQIGPGALQAPETRTGLQEFDALMERFDRMTERIQRLVTDVETKEAQRSRSELEKLYYQINPHFLMNSLNSIHWLARIKEQDEIRDLALHLNVILSYSLGKSVDHPTLRTELEVLRNYVKLEQARHSFSVNFEVTEGAYLDMPSPRLILQPLVENAIGHGMDVGGLLTVRAEPCGEGARITIADDGVGLDEETVRQLNAGSGDAARNGIGLRYVRSMLDSYYGEDASIHFASAEGKGMTVVILLGVTREEA